MSHTYKDESCSIELKKSKKLTGKTTGSTYLRQKTTRNVGRKGAQNVSIDLTNCPLDQYSCADISGLGTYE